MTFCDMLIDERRACRECGEALRGFRIDNVHLRIILRRQYRRLREGGFDAYRARNLVDMLLFVGGASATQRVVVR